MEYRRIVTQLLYFTPGGGGGLSAKRISLFLLSKRNFSLSKCLLSLILALLSSLSKSFKILELKLTWILFDLEENKRSPVILHFTGGSEEFSAIISFL